MAVKDKKKLLKEGKELNEKLIEYSEAYYNNGESPISDVEYDKLLKRLEEIEEVVGEVEGSMNKRVGASVESTLFTKVTHRKPMLSLSNTYSKSDLEGFHKRMEKESDNPLKYALELKIDGVSISITYKDGKLVQGVTRGDGEVGEDVTKNILAIDNIPNTLNKKVSLEVRGEVVLPRKTFEKINKERIEKNEQIFANPRNAASGTLKQLDDKIVKERGLDCYFFFLVDQEEHGVSTHSESIKYLEELGLKTTGVCEVVDSVEELVERIGYWETEKNNLPYDTDGMVVKVDDIKLWEKLGNRTKSPRWAVAYKFPAIQVTTKLKDITWQVGRTGKVTPVAELEEVELSGSKVKRASLHNYDEILRKDIMIGDTVFIEKAAEIIPQVVKVVVEARKDGVERVKIVEPTRCPVCGDKVEKTVGEVDAKCINISCPAKLKGRINYYSSRDAMNITGFGEKIIALFVEKGYVEDIVDIFTLKEIKEELYTLDNFGNKRVDNLLEAIEKSKERDYSKTLYALGIPFVGKSTARLLTKLSGNIKNLMTMEKDKFLEIEGVGEKVATSIVDYFGDEKNKERIERLIEFGVNFEEKVVEVVEVVENKFQGKKFLFTGKLNHFTRNEIKEKIESIGGVNSSSVSKNLDYLIVGEKAGSKLKKAMEIENITILKEEEFLEELKNQGL